MAFQAVITQTGLDKAISAAASGVQLQITHIAAGTAGYSADRTRTALSAEVDRVMVSGGNNVSATQIHLTSEFKQGEYTCRELGFFLADGTLFAVTSHPTNAIFYKTTANTVVQAFDLVLDALPQGSVTVNTTGDLSLYYAETFANINTAIATNAANHLKLKFDLMNKGVI